MFYSNLEEVMKKYPSFGDGTRLFCLCDRYDDGTKSKRVFASKGSKHPNKVTSDERGDNILYLVAITAQFLPQVIPCGRQ